MNLTDAARIVRKELLIRDQPEKAYYLLEKLNLPELKEEFEKTKGMIAHLFDYERYKKYYGEELFEPPNPEQYVLSAELRFMRFGWILKKVEEEKAKTVLDAGCADGILVTTLANRGYEATGVNLYKPSIEVANQRKEKYGLGKAYFICDDILNVQGKWDAVVAQEIIEHIPDPVKLVKHLADLTTDNGWVYLTTPDGPALGGLGNKPNWEWDGKGLRGHLRVYNEKTLRELLKDYEIKAFFKDKDFEVDYLFVQFRKRGENGQK